MPEPITIGILVCAGAGASVGVHSLLQRGYYSLKDWIYGFFYGKKLYSRDDANDIFAAITLYLHENFKPKLINSATITITININSGKASLHFMVPSPGEYIELSKELYIYSESRDGLRVDGYKIWYKKNPASEIKFKRLIKQLKSDARNIGKLLDNKYNAKLKKLSQSQESSSQSNPIILNIPTKN